KPEKPITRTTRNGSDITTTRRQRRSKPIILERTGQGYSRAHANNKTVPRRRNAWVDRVSNQSNPFAIDPRLGDAYRATGPPRFGNNNTNSRNNKNNSIAHFRGSFGSPFH